jgi:Arc/MetJ family transcription regulator
VRTNIEIDDKLMRAARKARPGVTKRALVEEGLRLVAELGAQAQIRSLRGQLKWEGDLEKMRNDAR